MVRLKKASLVLVLSFFLLFGGSGGHHISPIELAASPFLYDILTWELGNIPDKWVHKLNSFLPWTSSSREERIEDLMRFFSVGEEIHSLERRLTDLRATNDSSQSDPNNDAQDLTESLKQLRTERSRLKAGVEETLESELGSVLSQEGLSSWTGLIFPPVDVALVGPPRVLIVSPRDKIERRKTLLLEPDMDVEAMEGLEDTIFREEDLSALVEGLGGLATYPTIVRDDLSLRGATTTASHEWLHTYWFFRPLGWKIFSSPEMNTLNETAADLAGEELGDLVYLAVTGELPDEDPPGQEQEDDDEGRFDFSREMHETRVGTDQLLKEGKIEEAEAYMEQRRVLFVQNGYFIRKLNQAYFAFHGTYADSPASVSPIGEEVDRLRSVTGSVGDFIRTMAGFGSYQEFQDYLDENTSPDQSHLYRPIALP